MAIVTVPPTQLDIAVAKRSRLIPGPELSALRNCLPGELTSIFSARLQPVGGCPAAPKALQSGTRATTSW